MKITHMVKTATACFRYMLFEIEGFIKLYQNGSPRQRQNAVHVSPAVLHLHFFSQVRSALQSHLISSLQLTEAASRVIQTGLHPVPSLVHPKPSGLKVNSYDRLHAISPDTGLV